MWIYLQNYAHTQKFVISVLGELEGDEVHREVLLIWKKQEDILHVHSVMFMKMLHIHMLPTIEIMLMNDQRFSW